MKFFQLLTLLTIVFLSSLAYSNAEPFKCNGILIYLNYVTQGVKQSLQNQPAHTSNKFYLLVRSNSFSPEIIKKLHRQISLDIQFLEHTSKYFDLIKVSGTIKELRLFLSKPVSQRNIYWAGLNSNFHQFVDLYNFNKMLQEADEIAGVVTAIENN